MPTLAEILIKRLSKEQLQDILEAVTAEYEYGSCPLCGWNEIPTDEDDNELEEGDEATPSAYKEVHDDECFVTLIEKSFSSTELKADTERIHMTTIKYTLRGHYGSYTINDTVILAKDDSRDPKAVLWAKYRREGLLTLPMASTNLKVVKTEELNSD